MDTPDEPKYNLGEAATGRHPRRWEDLDDETRARLTQTVIEVVRSRESLLESLRPVYDQLNATLSSIQPLAQVFTATFARIAHQVADALRLWVPNWPDDLDQERAWAITGEGIPLAFVPGPEMTRRLVQATSHQDRLNLLADNTIEILDDCRRALQPEWDAEFPDVIAMLRPLLLQAIDVLEAGYPAAACALGIAVIDSLLHRTHRHTIRYPKLRNRSLQQDRDTAITLNELRVELAWRPLYSILTEWHPNSGKPIPKMASRHTVTHWANPDHLSETNALLTIMAATSLFRGLAERQGIADDLRR